MSLIDKLKELFAATESAKFLDAKLVDGTIIRTEAEEFKPGDQLMFMTEDGQLIKATEGMHETQDGIVIVTDNEGIITEVRKPEVNEEEMSAENTEITPTENTETVSVEAAEEVAEPETPAEVEVEVEKPADDADARIKALEEKVATLEQAIAMLIDGVAMQKTEMSTVKAENEALKTKNEELGKVPATVPVNTKKFERVLGEHSENRKNGSNDELILKVASLREKK